jgi:protein-S-isoprenylcysteine O-methyltransferase Ste14
MSGRGGGWVVAQFVLMAGIVVALFLPPGWPDSVRTQLALAGAALALAGVGVVVAAGLALGRWFTPFPRPEPGAELVVKGPYRVVRHPLYAGGLLFFCGLSLIGSIAALVATGSLALLWGMKSRVEERHLLERFPAYPGYAARVRRRFIPGVY